MRIVSGRNVPLFLGLIAMFASTLTAAGPPQGWEQPPDLVLRPDFAVTILAGSPGQTQRFRISALQTKDQWIQGFDFQPGDARVVQCAFFYIDKTNRWLGSWMPGQKMMSFPRSVAAYLPAESKIVVEIHYQSASSDIQDRSSVAVYFADRKPLRPLTGMGLETRVQVPATQASFRFRKEFTVIDDSYALAVRPEMRAAGRGLEVTSLDPSGVSQVLLTVQNFDQDAQRPYVFEQPLFMAKGTRIVATALYQNGSDLDADDLFKLTISMYPSAEYRPDADPPAVKRRAPRRSAVKKPATAKGKKPTVQAPALPKKPATNKKAKKG